jgi:hypothetical protein
MLLVNDPIVINGARECLSTAEVQQQRQLYVVTMVLWGAMAKTDME